MSDKKYVPCGGCGATHPSQVCIGCMHLFPLEEEPHCKIHIPAIIGHGKPESCHQQGAVWMKSDYDRLYDQVKGGKKTVCYVDYNVWGTENVYRDICTIRAETMEFSSRGHGYGTSKYSSGVEKELFVQLCESIHVEWLDESNEQPVEQRNEAVAFAEWLLNEVIGTDENTNDNKPLWIFRDGRRYTTAQLYNEWKQSNKSVRMNQLTDNGIFAYPIPDGNYEWKIIVVDRKSYLNGIDDTGEMLAGLKPLPPGSYEFLFCTKGASEEQARKVIRELPVGARYENYNGGYPVWYHTGKESLGSLLRAKGCDSKKNYALIQKLKQ